MGEVSQCFHFFCITFFSIFYTYSNIYVSVQFSSKKECYLLHHYHLELKYQAMNSENRTQLSNWAHTHINTTVVLWGLERSHLLNFQSWAESSKVSWNPNVRFCLIATTGFQDSLPCSCTEISQGLAQRGIKSDLEFVSDLSTLPVMRNWAACWIYSFF